MLASGELHHGGPALCLFQYYHFIFKVQAWIIFIKQCLIIKMRLIHIEIIMYYYALNTYA